MKSYISHNLFKGLQVKVFLLFVISIFTTIGVCTPLEKKELDVYDKIEWLKNNGKDVNKRKLRYSKVFLDGVDCMVVDNEYNIIGHDDKRLQGLSLKTSFGEFGARIARALERAKDSRINETIEIIYFWRSSIDIRNKSKKINVKKQMYASYSHDNKLFALCGQVITFNSDICNDCKGLQ